MFSGNTPSNDPSLLKPETQACPLRVSRGHPAFVNVSLFCPAQEATGDVLTPIAEREAIRGQDLLFGRVEKQGDEIRKHVCRQFKGMGAAGAHSSHAAKSATAAPVKSTISKVQHGPPRPAFAAGEGW
jgi:hypothetical protein